MNDRDISPFDFDSGQGASAANNKEPAAQIIEAIDIEDDVFDKMYLSPNGRVSLNAMNTMLLNFEND